MDKTLLDALTLTDADKAEFMSEAAAEINYNACADMVFKAMDNAIEAGAKKSAFLTKLTLIARYAYLMGYGTALTDVQLVQQHELAEAQRIEAHKGA